MKEKNEFWAKNIPFMLKKIKFNNFIKLMLKITFFYNLVSLKIIFVKKFKLKQALVKK